MKLEKLTQEEIEKIKREVNRFLEKGKNPVILIPKQKYSYPRLRQMLKDINYSVKEDEQFIGIIVGKYKQK